MLAAETFTLTLDPNEQGVLVLFTVLSLFSLGFIMFGGGRP